jgi:hypothetical protein
MNDYRARGGMDPNRLPETASLTRRRLPITTSLGRETHARPSALTAKKPWL